MQTKAKERRIRVRTGVRAGMGLTGNHNERAVPVRTGVRAGGASTTPL